MGSVLAGPSALLVGVAGGFLGMAPLAQAPSVLGVVGVEAACYEFAAVDGPVVGVLAGLGAAEHARRVLGEYGGSEPGLVLAAVSALPCAAASLVGFAPVVWALPALVGVLRAAGLAAYSPAGSSGHVVPPSVL